MMEPTEVVNRIKEIIVETTTLTKSFCLAHTRGGISMNRVMLIYLSYPTGKMTCRDIGGGWMFG